MQADKVVSSENQPSCARRCRCRLIVFLVIVVLIAAGVGVAWYQISGKLRMSEPYQEALALVQKDPKVIERLGQPIRDSWLPPSGSVYGENANLIFKVAGPKGRATVSTEARKFGGKWALRGLYVTFQDDKRISLDTAPAGGGEGEAPKFTPTAPAAPTSVVETPALPPLTASEPDIKLELPDLTTPAKTPPEKTPAEKKAPETKPPVKK
jgi:hypothetical protein